MKKGGHPRSLCLKQVMFFQIKEIIRQGVEVPEGQNDLRRMQLRELALLNGTLRENEGPRCSNCGASDHKSWMVCYYTCLLLYLQGNVLFDLNKNHLTVSVP